MEIPYPILPEPQVVQVTVRPTGKTTVIKPAKPAGKATTTQAVKPVVTGKPHKKNDSDADDAAVFLIIALVFVVLIVVGYLVIRRLK